MVNKRGARTSVSLAGLVGQVQRPTSRGRRGNSETKSQEEAAWKIAHCFVWACVTGSATERCASLALLNGRHLVETGCSAFSFLLMSGPRVFELGSSGTAIDTLPYICGRKSMMAILTSFLHLSASSGCAVCGNLFSTRLKARTHNRNVERNGEWNGEQRSLFWLEVFLSNVRKRGKHVSFFPLKPFDLCVFKAIKQPHNSSKIAVPFAVPFAVPPVCSGLKSFRIGSCRPYVEKVGHTDSL